MGKRFIHKFISTKNLWVLFGIILSGMIIWGCSLNDKSTISTGDDTGSGSETVGIKGKIIEPETQEPVDQASVKLYVKVSGLDGNLELVLTDSSLTDSLGQFEFLEMDSGSYLISAEIVSGSKQLALVSEIHHVVDTVIYLENSQLQIAGTLKGEILVEESEKSGYSIYLNNTPFETITDTNGNFLLTNVPPGEYVVSFIDTIRNLFLDTSISGIKVLSNDTVVIPPLAPTKIIKPPFQKKLILNTSNTGANVSQNVSGFPLMVKLDSLNFDFIQTLPFGEDIRFVKDSKLLTHEIEYWSVEKNEAYVWVLVDTILGSDSGQFISLLWGDSINYRDSIDTEVFSNNNGYQSVWHLDSLLQNKVKPSELGSNVGTKDTLGRIGRAKYFNGTDNYLKLPPVQLNDSITVSLWMYSESYVQRGMLIQEDPVNARWELFMEDSPEVEGIPGLKWRGGSYPGITTTFPQNGAWHQVVVTQFSDSVYMFLDGIQVIQDTTFVIKNGLDSLTVGNTNNEPQIEYYFEGIIDEISISSVRRSSEWIRLQYENQKKNSDLIIWRDP